MSLAQYLKDLIRTEGIDFGDNAGIRVEYNADDRVLTLTKVNRVGDIEERGHFRLVEVEKQWTEVPR